MTEGQKRLYVLRLDKPGHGYLDVDWRAKIRQAAAGCIHETAKLLDDFYQADVFVYKLSRRNYELVEAEPRLVFDRIKRVYRGLIIKLSRRYKPEEVFVTIQLAQPTISRYYVVTRSRIYAGGCEPARLTVSRVIPARKFAVMLP